MGRLLKEDIQEVIGIEELPQETVSVRSTDFPVKVIDRNGFEMIHLIEFQSDWDFSKIWELPAREYLDKGVMLPFIPLMEGGLSLTNDAERLIYSSGDEHKADNLTILTILTGLRDPVLSLELIKRRRDIMIQSPVYDLILQEGIEQGIERGSFLKACETAEKMLLKGMQISEISEITGLSTEVIDGIRMKIHENEA